MARTRSLRLELLKVFGYRQWPDLWAKLKVATEPYAVTVDWRCMALARRRDGGYCAFGERISRLPEVDKSFVAEWFTYIRFHGSEMIWKYNNSLEMTKAIQHLDAYGQFDIDMEDGDVFILEAPGKARNSDYSRERRRRIKEGTWPVKPRGPNPNMRRIKIHHFRPY
jgi:hypothetical protein